MMQLGHATVHFGDKNGKYPDGNQVIVTGSDTKVAFDLPVCSRYLRDELQGTDLVVLGHVHEDHVAGLRLLPDAVVAAPEQDAPALRSLDGLRAHYGYSEETWERFLPLLTERFDFEPRPDATAYADGAMWDLGGCRVRAVHAPGHTAGHSVLVVEPAGVAFLGDIDLSSFGPYYGDATSSLPAFRRTLQLVRELDVGVWITFHHKGVVTDRETFLSLLSAFERRLDERSAAIVGAIGAGVATLEQLVEHRFLYPRGYGASFVDDVERASIRAHLAELEAAGRLVAEGARYRTVAGA